MVRYRIEISKKAREQLRALSKEHRRNIGWRMEEMREDLEDLRDLQAAIAENGAEPLIPWEQAKAELNME